MANPEHLKVLRKGVKIWNEWREKNSGAKPDLHLADLKGLDLQGANLAGADLSRADLTKTNLTHADLSKADFWRAKLSIANLVGADLYEADVHEADFDSANLSNASCLKANLSGAKLCGAVLREADLRDTNFSFTSLAWANLHKAVLRGASLRGADLSSADLSDADLSDVNLTGADLTKANFDSAMIESTVFVSTDLSNVKGLDSIQHFGPSAISIETLYMSRGRIPENFLRDVGVPEEAIEHLLPLIRVGPSIQWHSCFISYSAEDEGFAQRLHTRMRQARLRVWFAPEDIKGGDYFFEQIERAIQLHDRLLLVLSKSSIRSKWVEREIRKARKIERAEKRKKLFPITLMDYDELKKWECLDYDTGEDLAEEVRKYHIPDFSNWKNHDAFKIAFARLEKDLRTSIGK